MFTPTDCGFNNKMYIALKECSETICWLDLLRATDRLTETQHASISTDAVELRKILSSITKTVRDKLATPDS